MAINVGSLAVSLSADGSALARGLDAASLKVTAFERISTRSAASSETALSGAFGRIGTAATMAATKLAQFGAGLSVTALAGFAASAAQVARRVAEIGDAAKLAGLSTKAFQELGFVARQNRIAVDTLADGLKELQLRADEWVKTGSGSGAESFQRLGYSAEELRRKLQRPSDLFVEIIARMEKLNSAARIRVADELFGGQAGERFKQLVDQGAAAIRAQIKEANDLGIVFDDKVIKRAEVIDAKFQKISDTIGTSLKGAVVDVAAGLDTWIDSFKEIDKQTSDNVLRRLQDVYAKKAAAEDALAGMQAISASGFGGAYYAGEIERQRAEVERLANEAARLRDILDTRAGWPGADAAGKAAADATPSVQGLVDTLASSVPTTAAATEGMKAYASALQTLQQAVPGLADSLDDLNKRDAINAAYADALKNARSIGDQQRAEQARNAALAALDVPKATGGVVPPTPVADPRKSLSYEDPYAQTMKTAREASAQLEMERQALRLTTVEADALRRAFELLNQVQAQNGEVTPEQRAEIIKLASDQAILADEIDRAKAKTEEFTKTATEGFKDIADSIGQALVGTKDWKTVLGDVVSLLIKLASNWLGPKIATALGVATPAATTDSVAATVSKTLSGSAANDNVSTALASNVASLAAYREAIGSIESSGDYSALGQVLSSGDRAYGKYQVMGNNIGPWTKDALGYSMTPQQFLNSPWAQDAVFNQQFGNSLAKYGNANDAASVWFTGRPMSSGSSAVDALGTSGSQYVTNFNSALEKTTGSLGNMNSTVTEAVNSLGSATSKGGTSLLGGSTAAVAQSASSGPLDLGQFTGAGATGGGFLTSITGLFTNIFSGIGDMLSNLLGGIANGAGGLFSTIFGALFNANGNAFGPGGLTAFAGGGAFTNSVVNTPTMFKFGNGSKFGVMGEAGAEAIMPLSKDSSGRLGVSLHSAVNDNWASAMGNMAKVAAGAAMSGGGTMSYRGGDTIIQGDVTEDIWPRVRMEIEASAAETKKDVARNFGAYHRMSREND